jgi:DNA-binding HxlR family transcriptional regulator
VTASELARQLKELETNKIVERRAYLEIPPRVEYSLTKSAENYVPLLHDLMGWCSEHASKLGR